MLVMDLGQLYMCPFSPCNPSPSLQTSLRQISPAATAHACAWLLCSFLTLAPFLWYQLGGHAASGACAGLAALAFNAAFNACLLLLFAQFYREAYQRKRALPPKKEA
jgi:GNS1/SUR4 family